MKPALILFFIVLTACGSGGGSGSGGASTACRSSFNWGQWTQNAGTEYWDFNADCTGTQTSCGLSFNYANVGTNEFADITMTITASNGGACPAVGSQATCDWSTPGTSQIILTCSFIAGGAAIQYSRTGD